MKLLITQSNYIPWRGYFDAINMADVFVLYDTVQYTKRDWRNRNRVLTKSGPTWLSIPVHVKGRYEQSIEDVIISDSRWQLRHWSTISHAYRKAVYFSQIATILEPLYLGDPLIYLSEVNFLFLKTICQYLNIGTQFVRASTIQFSGDRNMRLLEICKNFGATTYFTGPSAMTYLDTDLFSREGVNVEIVNYEGYPIYQQLSDVFVPQLSIVDLLMNHGPNAKKYMKSFNE